MVAVLGPTAVDWSQAFIALAYCPIFQHSYFQENKFSRQIWQTS